jgi:hypothetical protein
MRRSQLALSFGATLVAVLVSRVWAQPSARSARDFQGYWVGVDPVDGGDARRSLVQLDNGKFALAARDTVLSLCDGTEHGFGSFEDGELVGRNAIQSNTLLLKCFNNGASVVLHDRFELLANGLMLEITTRADGTPVSTIIFHKVSN